MMAGMDLARAAAFLRTNHRAVLATRRRGGEPQLSPVVVAVDDDGRVLISTRESAVKVRNLRRDPRAWVCVMTDAFYGDWVQLAGAVEIVSMPDAMELLVEYYRLAAGEHPDWDDYRAAMLRERRCVIVLTPDAAGPEVAG
jgi:PPOX class probable F420-dependent enzyme